MASPVAARGPDLTVSSGAIALVGQPNVGKSLLFHALTGRHVMVSNYPGTTVEVSRAASRTRPERVVIDTPGVITLPPHSESEAVTMRLMLDGAVARLVHVGDAKSLRRTLLLATQLAEMGLPMVLALNMSDEAAQLGIDLDHRLLAAHLGIPVVPTVATSRLGMDALEAALDNVAASGFRVAYPPEVEEAVAAVATRVDTAPIAGRGLALLWLAGDDVTGEWLADHLDPATLATLHQLRSDLQLHFPDPIAVVIHQARREVVERMVVAVTAHSGEGMRGWRTRLGRWSAHPLWGLPVLAAVLGAMYWFVGRVGAGTLVDLVEEDLFGGVINPWVTSLVSDVIPVEFVVDLFVGEYGLWTMGMTYALALILPIVATFFLAFGVLEDSGYLPRLAVLANRAFRRIGLNGQAVVPMVLGLGCVTMATLTTRILGSKRERLLVILLLALAVPCSAQLGVVMGLLASVSFAATIIWASVVLGVLLAVGWLAARLIPGDRATLLVELPPLRRPVLSNVLLKTVARLEWYLKEVVPLFLAGTAALFLLDASGLLQRIIDAGEPLVVGWLGLPAAAGAAFLMGFLRRDFGATGLFALAAAGLLSSAQLLVAMVTITLFVPCIASVLMIAKERSWTTAAGVTAFIFPLAFLVGGGLSRLLDLVGWGAL